MNNLLPATDAPCRATPLHPSRNQRRFQFPTPVSEDKAEKSGNYSSPDACFFYRFPVTSGIFRDILVKEDLVNLTSHRRNQGSHKLAGGNLGVLSLTVNKAISLLQSYVFYHYGIIHLPAQIRFVPCGHHSLLCRSRAMQGLPPKGI